MALGLRCILAPESVNSTLVNVAADMGGDGHTNNVSVDAYGYTLYYYPNDYAAISASTGTAAPFETVAQTLATFNPLYNGNIAATAVNIPQIDVGVYNYYTHQYDQLNRLTHTEDYTTTGEGNTGLTHTDNYKEYFTYDGNGNILTTNRNGNTLNGNQLVMDQLTYNYNRDANGKLLNNRLGYIADAAPASNYTNDLKNQSTGNYQFDAKGDLTADQQAGVSNIQWTVYSKIQSLANSSGAITYTYDPAGRRATKMVAGVTTYYVRDAIGNTLATYDNAGGAINWREQDLYGSSRIGMWTPNMKLSSNNAQTIWDTVGHKSYELTNQLGNVMVTISDKRINSIYGINLPYYIPDITTAQHYYAFGSLMPGLTYTENGNYKYGFNGKENDNEIKGVGDQQDYGMRIYDPRAGRFLSVDPIANSFPALTTFQFASDDPVLNIDMDGLEGQSTAAATLEAARGQALQHQIDQTLTKQLAERAMEYSAKETGTEAVVEVAATGVKTAVNWGAKLSGVTLFIQLMLSPLDAGKGSTHTDVEPMQTFAHPSTLTPQEMKDILDRLANGTHTGQDLLYAAHLPSKKAIQLNTNKDISKISEGIVRERLERQKGPDEIIMVKPRIYIKDADGKVTTGYTVPDFAIVNIKTGNIIKIVDAKNGAAGFTDAQNLFNKYGGIFKGSKRFTDAKPNQSITDKIEISRTNVTSGNN